jgi:signal transduction histidine kinase
VRELVASTLPAAVSLQVEAPGPTPVIADAQDVFRILFNLLHNAASIARRTGALRTIRITLQHDAAMAVIKVSDDGPGVPESVRKRLFLGGRSTTGGSGHGLAIARELAERNGGTLKLADVSQGATFLVEVPLDPSAIDRVATLSGARERLFSPRAVERGRSEHAAA